MCCLPKLKQKLLNMNTHRTFFCAVVLSLSLSLSLSHTHTHTSHNHRATVLTLNNSLGSGYWMQKFNNNKTNVFQCVQSSGFQLPPLFVSILNKILPKNLRSVSVAHPEQKCPVTPLGDITLLGPRSLKTKVLPVAVDK